MAASCLILAMSAGGRRFSTTHLLRLLSIEKDLEAWNICHLCTGTGSVEQCVKIEDGEEMLMCGRVS